MKHYLHHFYWNLRNKNRVIIPAMEGTNIIENMMGPKFNEKSKQYYIERANNDVGLFIPGMIPVYSMMGGKWLHKILKYLRKQNQSLTRFTQTDLKYSSNLAQVLREEITQFQINC